MTTFTRDDLQAAWVEEQLKNQEETIVMYVKAITSDVISHNKKGNKKYKKILYKEPDVIKTEVIKQLQSIFIDSIIVYTETDHGITIDWTISDK